MAMTEWEYTKDRIKAAMREKEDEMERVATGIWRAMVMDPSANFSKEDPDIRRHYHDVARHAIAAMNKDKPKPKVVTPEQVEMVTQEVGMLFRTFGGGRTRTFETPISAALKDKPLTFAGDVQVADVVRFVMTRELP